MPSPVGTKLALVTGGAAVAVLAAAGAASAHVTVNPGTATQGSFTELSFRMPNEQDAAKSTRLQVFFPTDHPIAFVSVRPHTGWHISVQTEKLSKPITTSDGTVTQAVRSITWTADSSATALGPGQYDDFDVSAGPLPDVSSMEFKALQTYSNGQVVRWIDNTVPGGPEPEHPAPTLTLTPANAATAVTASPSNNGTATTALVLSIIALVVALGGAAASVLRRGSSKG